MLACVDLLCFERPMCGRIGLGSAVVAHERAFYWEWMDRVSGVLTANRDATIDDVKRLLPASTDTR